MTGPGPAFDDVSTLLQLLLPSGSAFESTGEVLRATQDLYRSIVLASPDNIAITTLDGRMVTTSRAGVAMFGLQDEAHAVGRSLTDFLVPEDRERAARNVLGMLQGSFPGPERYRGLRVDGTMLDIEVNGAIIPRADGTPAGFVFIVRDVTRLRVTEDLLREAAERDRLLVTESLDGIVRMTVPDGRMLDLNPAACTILGVTRDAALTMSAFDLFAPDDQGPIRAVEAGEDSQRSFDRRILRPDGVERTIASRGRRLPDGTHLVSFRDVTVEREHDARIAAAQRLEAVGRLAGGVAHEFNNALMAIMGIGELLAEALPDVDARRTDALHIVATAARASRLTRQLLAFGRAQTLRMTAVDLGALLDDIRPLLVPVLGPDIELDVRMPAEAAVLADPAQLEQVVVDLVLSAHERMPAGGTIRVTADTIELEATEHARPWARSGRYVRLAVADSGPVIPADAIPHLFEPFFGSPLLGRDGAGSPGLGLATVEGIVAQTGGWIEVRSGEESGSTFLVHLPAASADATAVVALSTTPAPPARMLLVVDDNALVLGGLSRLLESGGYTVIAASGAPEALALDDERLAAVDALVTDVVMPGMGGVELAAALEARRPGLPVVFMSGYAPEGDVQARLARPGAEFLPKPCGRADIDAAVRRLVGAA